MQNVLRKNYSQEADVPVSLWRPADLLEQNSVKQLRLFEIVTGLRITEWRIW